MYGIVNKAVEELVTEKFGSDAWTKVREKSGIEVDFFISNEPYDDDITYKLATAASEVLTVPMPDIMHALGEFWILQVGKKKYGGLMEAGGRSFREFIINLPQFHSRIMLLYPKLTPPEFRISNLSEQSVDLHYFSHRKGLKDFVSGLLRGLAKMYSTDARIELVADRGKGYDHEVFRITWEKS